jgi:hypothetical protein
MVRRIILVTILCVAFSLRVYHLADRMWWSGDQGRDLLVASHVVRFHEAPAFGHSASFLVNPFHYPQHYYYLLACLSFLRNDPVAIAYMLIPLHLLGLIAVYYIGKHYYSPASGILAAFWYAISNKMIEVGSVIWPAYLAIPIAIIGYAFVLHRRWRMQLFGLALIVLATTIHLSAFLVLLWAWVVVVWRRRSLVGAGVTTLSIIILEIIAYFPIIDYFGIHTFIERFSPLNNLSTSSVYIQNTTRLIVGYCRDLFGYSNVHLYISLVGMVFLLGMLFWKRKSTSFTLLLFTALSLLVAGAKGGQQGTHYVVILTPFLLLGLSQVVNVFYEFHKKHFIVIVAALCSIIGTTYGLTVNFHETFQRVGNMQQYKDVADFIYDYNKNISGTTQKNYRLSAGSTLTTPDWERYGVWYFLERKYGKITSLSQTYGNVTELKTTGNVYYQICFYYPKDRVIPDCLNDFEHLNPSYVRLRQIPYNDPSVSVFEYIKSL